MASPRFKRVVAIMALLTVATYLAEPYVGARTLGDRRAAEDFALPTVENTTFHLAPINNGTVVVLDFMATWCPPCRDELRELSQVRAGYPASRVVIVSVDVDYSETAGQLRAFRDTYAPGNRSTEAAGWYFANDMPGQYVGPKYGANALPTLVLLDPSGHVAHTWIGGVQAAQLKAAIDAAFAAAA